MRKLLLIAFVVLPFVMCEVTTTVTTTVPTVGASIYNARFVNAYDNDDDGYPSEFDLEFDPDVDDVSTMDIYVDVYGKLSSESQYTLITTTSTITITGDAITYYSVALTGGSHGGHDFMLYLYDADTDVLLDTYGPSLDSDLDDHLEETPYQDAVSIHNAEFRNQVDYDDDGYPSEFDLAFDPDVSGGATRTIHVELYGRVTGNSSWNYITVTNDITIQGTASVYYEIPLSGGSRGRHDFLLDVYDSDTGELLTSYGPLDDSDLSGHYEETPAED
ncbi:MAG: hypothetical protein GF331_06085 [Chitinivibrionales bacterium]|nr:hypothetical protein [Chitinivibrionales bacterium]